MWKSDGTAAGTVQVKSITALKVQANVNGSLYFGASDVTNGAELWKSDGTTAGTVLVKDIRVGSTSGLPFFNYMTNVNGTLFFVADNSSGQELWKSDGTAAGTVLVRDINPGSGSSFGIATSSNLTNVNGTLYFHANDGTNGDELWKSEGFGSSAILVKDIAVGTRVQVQRT